MKLSILIPVYNERYLAAELLRRVLAAPLPEGLEREVIVVDDGSTDGTREILEALARERPEVQYVPHPMNRGKGAAIRTAIGRARGDFCLFQDADLEYDPADYPKLLEPLLEGKADAVYGSRYMPGPRRRVLSYWHTKMNRTLTALSNFFTDLDLTDVETCYKAIRTEVLKTIPIRRNDFGIEVELTAKLAKRNVRIYEVPISYDGRTYAEGKKITWRDGYRALYVILKYWLIDDLYDERTGHQILADLSRAHRFNRWMAQRVRPHLGHRVLEIGAGIGNLTAQLLPRERYVASDLDDLHLDVLRNLALRRKQIEVLRIDAQRKEDFASLRGRIDSIVCLNVLEHIPNASTALGNFFRRVGAGRPPDRTGPARRVALLPARQGPRTRQTLPAPRIGRGTGSGGVPGRDHLPLQSHRRAGLAVEREDPAPHAHGQIPVEGLRQFGLALAAHRFPVPVARPLDRRGRAQARRPGAPKGRRVSEPAAPRAEAEPAWWQRPRAERAAAALLLLYAAALFAQMQFGAHGLYERDGYFHARFAQQFPSFGLTRQFPWTQFSTWKDQFADKEFLFHLLMVPFARLAAEPLTGAKTFILCLDLAVCAALWQVLRRTGVRGAVCFAALLLCMGGPFLIRIAMIRSHVLSILLTLVGVHFLLRRDWKWTGLVGFAFAWSYTVPLVLALIAAPFAVGRWIGGERFDWRCPAAALGGALLGMAVHPYTPLTLEVLRTIAEILFMGAQGKASAALELGKEIYPYSTRSFLLAFPLLTLLLLALPLAGWRLGKRAKPETLGALAAALAWIAMTLVFSRFMEYAVPLFVVALALLARDALEGFDLREEFVRKHPWAARAVGAGLLLALAGFHIQGVLFALDSMRELPPARFKKASEWMAAHLDPGETVVNLWWDDFPELYYDGYRQHYLVGLDPTFMQRRDRQEGTDCARLLEEIRTRRRPLDGPLLARTFGARYMILRAEVAGAYPELTDRTWGYVYKDDWAAIYALDGPEGPPAGGAPRDPGP
ncbi:MAG: glycosyltransferase [Planctomycetota bacterium]|nr:glycosyltransferase [Planctomycetota bacterium]